MVGSIESMRIDLGLAQVSGVVKEINRYLEKTQPWTLGKKGEKLQLGTVMYFSVEALRIVSGLFYAVMPQQMSLLRKTLGFSEEEPDFKKLKKWGQTKPGTAVGEMINLFPRIVANESDGNVNGRTKMAEEKTDQKSSDVAGESKSSLNVCDVSQIDYSEFAKIRLRTAVILTAERIEGAGKILRLKIRMGEEERQIVAGIALHYKPEDLPGKTIVIVANLKPARIRGIESNGMLLAASEGGSMRLVTLDGDLPSGATVK
jgi:methionyl-tRNA synthetase